MKKNILLILTLFISTIATVNSKTSNILFQNDISGFVQTCYKIGGDGSSNTKIGGDGSSNTKIGGDGSSNTKIGGDGSSNDKKFCTIVPIKK